LISCLVDHHNSPAIITTSRDIVLVDLVLLHNGVLVVLQCSQCHTMVISGGHILRRAIITHLRLMVTTLHKGHLEAVLAMVGRTDLQPRAHLMVVGMIITVKEVAT